MTASCRSCVALQMVSNALIALGERFGAVAVGHGVAQHRGDFERLGHQHRGLVRHADVPEILVRVEPGRDGLAEPRHERVAVAAVPRM